MTTTELITLLKKGEFGASGRPREITISKVWQNGIRKSIIKEDDELIFDSSGDGCAGAELGLIIIPK
ncbi:MAG: hypothetical protein GY849_02235 [Deltaproteobacteria bacterium]|nr:hypothetical protein [Deltaproteobacteria bacterium]